MHRLLQYRNQVNKTHKGLGNLFSYSLLVTKAKKVGIIIAVAGSGKTTAIEAAAKANKKDYLMFDSITRSGLKPIEQKLNGFEGTFVINDLGNIDTAYSSSESIKTAVMLTYEHHLNKLNSTLNLNIENFYGSFITSAQPAIMQRIVNTVDWEAVVRDKTTRYYHLPRPTKPNKNHIEVNVNWGIDIDLVKYKQPKGIEFDEFMQVGLSQWGLSRAHIHIEDMLKACAALDNRKAVRPEDVKVCLELTKPMRLENYVVEKLGFESHKEFMHNHVCLLTEFATYGHQITKQQIASDFFMSLRNVNRVLQDVRELYTEDPHDSAVLHASEETFKILEDCGYWTQ